MSSDNKNCILVLEFVVIRMYYTGLVFKNITSPYINDTVC